MKFLLFLLTVTAVAAAPSPGLLDRPVENLRLENAPLPTALRSLARAAQTNILIDPDVTGEITTEINHGTLRSALTALTEPGGYYFEETPDGMAVRFRRTVLYAIDYPQLTRSGSGSASITLGGVNNGYGANGQALTASQTQGSNTQAQTDATQVSISQENQNTFWSGLEAELRAMLKDGDSLILNKFSGVAQVTAPVRRHETIRAFIELVNRRITQQVEIEARIVEVTLRDEQKLGVDWDLAATTARQRARQARRRQSRCPASAAPLLAANTFAANLGFGRASAVIQALQQQGEVKTVAQPKLRALNNQTAFIKVGEDRPFFRLQQTTTYQQAAPRRRSIRRRRSFSVSTITIGTILAVTPQIDGDGVDHARRASGNHAVTGHRHESGRAADRAGHRSEAGLDHRAAARWRNRDHRRAHLGGNGRTPPAVPVLGAVPVVGRVFRSKATLSRPDRTGDLPHAPARPLTMLDFIQTLRGHDPRSDRRGRIRAAIRPGLSTRSCAPRRARARATFTSSPRRTAGRPLPARRRNARARAAAGAQRERCSRGEDFRRHGHHRKRLPQDGRAVLREADGASTCDLSTLPTVHGESLVIRLLDQTMPARTSANLGWHRRRPTRARSAGRSGRLDLPHRADRLGQDDDAPRGAARLDHQGPRDPHAGGPGRIRVPGIRQTEIREKIGLTFASSLRALLRQNPDVLLVGETRDAETAQLAIRAALTGHLVLSTLHTNDALAAIPRLRDLGVESFSVWPRRCGWSRRSGSCAGFAAECKAPHPDNARLRKSTACRTRILPRGRLPRVPQRGFRGRLAIHEVIPPEIPAADRGECAAGELAALRDREGTPHACGSTAWPPRRGAHHHRAGRPRPLIFHRAFRPITQPA
jgi:MSHA biogenesis protein MshL